jgi:hypothetical protein
MVNFKLKQVFHAIQREKRITTVISSLIWI